MSDYEEAYQDGYEVGHDEGYAEGEHYGYEDGFVAGLQEGLSSEDSLPARRFQKITDTKWDVEKLLLRHHERTHNSHEHPSYYKACHDETCDELHRILLNLNEVVD